MHKVRVALKLSREQESTEFPRVLEKATDRPTYFSLLNGLLPQCPR